MPKKKDSKDPSTTSLAFDIMYPKHVKVQTVLDGTDAMRGAAESFLPRHDNEHEDTYLERLNGNVLRNITAQTLDTWVGKPFSTEPIVNDDVPSLIADHLDDIDLRGNKGHVFMRNWFREGLAKGVAPVLVEYPMVDPMPNGRPRTQADDIREGVRPYWVKLRPEQIIDARSQLVNGKERFYHVRIKESVSEYEGFAQVVIQQIRVLELVAVPSDPGDPNSELVERMAVVLWQYRKWDGKKEEWREVGSWLTSSPNIKLVLFYSSESDECMVAKSPLEDLVDLNIRHWQSNSDQISILTVSRFPILALSGGVADDDELTVGPREWLFCSDPRGKFYYVEHSGDSIGAGKADLDDLLEQMADYGAEFLKRRPTNTPAASHFMDVSEATSPLQDAVIRFTDAVNLALEYHAQWMNMETGGTVKISTDFGPSVADSATLTSLQAARKGGDISRAKYLKALQEFGVLPTDFDFDQNEDELEQERVDLVEPRTEIDPAAPSTEQNPEEDDASSDVPVE